MTAIANANLAKFGRASACDRSHSTISIRQANVKQAGTRGRTLIFLASDLSFAHSLKSAFSTAYFSDLVVSLVLFHLLQDAVEVVGLRRL